MSWELRLRLQRAALAPVAAISGRWQGRGQAHGEPVTSALSIRPVLDGTMIEVRERTGEGEGAHEDICYYRWEIERQEIRVLHLLPGAIREYPVEQTPEGLIWVTPPEEPAVEWAVRGATLRQEVVWPEAGAPEVWIDYHRDDAPEASGAG